METERKIAKVVVRRRSLKDKTGDADYWRTRTPIERLAALEEIRREYNEWRYGAAQPRLQRVYRVIERS